MPREAVTKFLLGCVECQRRSDGDLSNSDKSKTPSTPKRHTDTHTPSPRTVCDQTVPSSSSSANPGSENNPYSSDSTQDLTNKLENETSFRHSSDDSKSLSSGQDTLEVKTESACDPYKETPKCVPAPMNLCTIRRRIPLNLHNLDGRYTDTGLSVIRKSNFPFSPDRSLNQGLSTSTPDSNRSDTTISKSSTSGSDISPIEPEHFQKPYPKKLYTIDPVTFETIRVPLKNTEISIYYDKNRPFIKPKKRFESDSPLDSHDFSIMSTYLRYMRHLGCSEEEALHLEAEAVSHSSVCVHDLNTQCV